MERIISLFELLVLVVFANLSVVTPMESGSSSSSAPVRSSQRPYELKFLIQGSATDTGARPKVYPLACIVLGIYKSVVNLDYELVTAPGDLISANTARNTDIVSMLGNKLKIRARNNVDVLYSLEFIHNFGAFAVGNYIIQADSEPYKKCNGSHTYKLQKIYMYTPAGHLEDMGSDYCIFKMHKTNMTTFTGEFLLTQLPNDKKKFELKISFGAEYLDPKYVLKTSTPDKLQAFLAPSPT